MLRFLSRVRGSAGTRSRLYLWLSVTLFALAFAGQSAVTIGKYRARRRAEPRHE